MKARHVLLTTDGARCDNILKIKPPMVFSCRDADRLVAELEVRLPSSMSSVLRSAVWPVAPAPLCKLQSSAGPQGASHAKWPSRDACYAQGVLEEFAGLTPAERDALLEAWRPPSGTPRDKVGVTEDPPLSGASPAAKRHKGS